MVLMATYGVDCGTTCYEHTGVQTSNNTGGGGDDLLSIYSMLSPTCYTDMASFKKCVLACLDGFKAGLRDHTQYIAFTGVDRKCMDLIDRLREGRSSLPKMMVQYDAIEEVLIVKIMPSVYHDTAARVFELFLFKKLTLLGADGRLVPVGSTKYKGANERSKEADNAYRPKARHRSDFPSLVVEVGVSESLGMLRNDARYWLTKSGGQTRIVIVLHIDTASRRILLQRWECIDRTRPHHDNVHYDPIVRAIQSLELVDGVQYTGDALVIPAVKVFDIVPNNVPPGAIEFTSNDLQAINDFYWTSV